MSRTVVQLSVEPQQKGCPSYLCPGLHPILITYTLLSCPLLQESYSNIIAFFSCARTIGSIRIIAWTIEMELTGFLPGTLLLWMKGIAMVTTVIVIFVNIKRILVTKMRPLLYLHQSQLAPQEVLWVLCCVLLHSLQPRCLHTHAGFNSFCCSQYSQSFILKTCAAHWCACVRVRALLSLHYWGGGCLHWGS